MCEEYRRKAQYGNDASARIMRHYRTNRQYSALCGRVYMYILDIYTIYIYIYIHTCVYVYIYMYIERGRERRLDRMGMRSIHLYRLPVTGSTRHASWRVERICGVENRQRQRERERESGTEIRALAKTDTAEWLVLLGHVKLIHARVTHSKHVHQSHEDQRPIIRPSLPARTGTQRYNTLM